MKRRSLKPLIWIGVAALFVVLLVLSSYPQVLGYWLFSMRSQGYYARVADACDQLIAQGGAFPREIKGPALESLPPVLRKLNPDHLIIRDDLVMVRVGGGIISHFIVWRSDETDPRAWRLSLADPESRKSHIVFSRRKPEAVNQSRQPTAAVSSTTYLPGVISPGMTNAEPVSGSGGCARC
jgi:hypothetical protein